VAGLKQEAGAGGRRQGQTAGGRRQTAGGRSRRQETGASRRQAGQEQTAGQVYDAGTLDKVILIQVKGR